MLVGKANKQERDIAVFTERAPASPDPDFDGNAPCGAVFIANFKFGRLVVTISGLPRPAQGIEIHRESQVQHGMGIEQS